MFPFFAGTGPFRTPWGVGTPGINFPAQTPFAPYPAQRWKAAQQDRIQQRQSQPHYLDKVNHQYQRPPVIGQAANLSDPWGTPLANQGVPAGFLGRAAPLGTDPGMALAMGMNNAWGNGDQQQQQDESQWPEPWWKKKEDQQGEGWERSSLANSIPRPSSSWSSMPHSQWG